MIPQQYIDQIGNRVALSKAPRRIISLVPSQTELLYDLGLDKEIVGVTKFCVHPKEKVKNATKVGGTKKFNFEIVEQLKPDLIIANKEENYKEGITKLQSNYAVWTSDIFNLSDALSMISEIGKLTETQNRAKELIGNIKQGWDTIESKFSGTALYFIWQNPYMLAANETYINFVLEHLGFENLASNSSRYPEFSLAQLREHKPDVVFLSSEPYPFKEKHIQTFRSTFPASKIKLVDGEMFSWYGSRLVKAVEYMQRLEI